MKEILWRKWLWAKAEYYYGLQLTTEVLNILLFSFRNPLYRENAHLPAVPNQKCVPSVTMMTSCKKFLLSSLHWIYDTLNLTLRLWFEIDNVLAIYNIECYGSMRKRKAGNTTKNGFCKCDTYAYFMHNSYFLESGEIRTIFTFVSESRLLFCDFLGFWRFHRIDVRTGFTNSEFVYGMTVCYSAVWGECRQTQISILSSTNIADQVYDIKWSY